MLYLCVYNVLAFIVVLECTSGALVRQKLIIEYTHRKMTSFVRSVTMDTWKPDEVTKMKVKFWDFAFQPTCQLTQLICSLVVITLSEIL
jgi:hypothetical protein